MLGFYISVLRNIDFSNITKKKNCVEKENFRFLNEFEKNFANNLKYHFNFLLNSQERIKILVGVSGGSDSICLLYLLYKLNEKIFYDKKLVLI